MVLITSEGQPNIFGGLIRRTVVVLTDAQIRALPTTPVEVVPTPGPGKALMPVMCVLVSKFIQPYEAPSSGGSEVEGASDLVLTWGDNVTNATDPALAMYFGAFFSNNRIAICQPTTQTFNAPNNATKAQVQARLGCEDTPLKLSADDGNPAFTGGSPANILQVTVYYIVIDLP